MMNLSKKISIFGATGSIGISTLDVIKRSKRGTFKVLGLSAKKNYVELARQAIETNAELAVITDETKYQELKKLLSGTSTKVAAGQSGMLEMCSLNHDFVMAAIVGSAGLLTTYHAIKKGVNIGLANKESLVCAGNIIKNACSANNTKLIPVDSEHNAIFQVFEKHNQSAISKIYLTASGGPFRKSTAKQFKKITKEQALAHPNWVMGQKITIDSATLFNKGLEIIEAHHLFDMPQEKIEVVVHPQSVIHSMVEYKDGSVLAQLGMPDMRTPITYALYWPQRYEGPEQLVENLDFYKLKQLTFEQPDNRRFPSLNLCRAALKAGSAASIMLNASNEIAVEYFLQDQIKFQQIFQVVSHMLDQCQSPDPSTIQEVIELDKEFRSKALKYVQTI